MNYDQEIIKWYGKDLGISENDDDDEN